MSQTKHSKSEEKNVAPKKATTSENKGVAEPKGPVKDQGDRPSK